MAKHTYVGVNGVARNTKTMPTMVSAVNRSVKTAYAGVSGVARKVFSGAAFALARELWDGRNGCVNEGELTSQRFYASTSGGTGTGYATNELRFTSGSQLYLFPAGTVVKFQFTGTRSGSYADYLFRVFTNSGDAYGSQIYQIANTNASSVTTYTFTQNAYMYFTTSIGGINSSTLSASITVTYLEIDGAVYIGS